MDICYPKRSSNICCNKFRKDVERNKNTSGKKSRNSKHKKNDLGLKKPIIVLEDFLLQKNILNDVSLMHNIPLKYRIANNKLRRSNNKKGDTDEFSKNHLFKNSILVNKLNDDSKIKRQRHNKRNQSIKSKTNNKTTKIAGNIIKRLNKNFKVSKFIYSCKANKSDDNFKERSPITIGKDNSNFCEENNDQTRKAEAFKITKKLDGCVDKVSLCDNNKFTMLSTKNLLENSQNNYGLKVSLYVEDTSNELHCKQNLILRKQAVEDTTSNKDQLTNNDASLQKENLNSESNYLLKKNDQKYTSKVTLQIKNKDLNNVIEESTKVNNLVILQNNINNDNSLPEDCTSALAIKSHDRNTEFAHISKSAEEGREEKNNIIRVTNKNLYKNIDLLSQKRINADQDTNNNAIKRIKLDKVHHLSDCTSELNAEQILPQDTTLNTSALNTVAQADENVVIQLTNGQLENKNNISSNVKECESAIVHKSSVENQSFSSIKIKSDDIEINKQDYSFQKNLKEEYKLTIDHKLPVENQSSFLTKEKSDEKEIIDEIDNSDYISLCADSALMDEYDEYASKNSSRSETLFNMTDKVFENYYKKTTSDFGQIYNNINENTVLKEITKLSNSKKITTVEKNDVPKKSLRSAQISSIQAPMIITKCYILKSIFPGYCYKFIYSGFCNRMKCSYRHNFLPLMIKYYEDDEQYFFSILSALASEGCTNFIRSFYQSLICHYDLNCILKVFKKLFELNILNNEAIFSVIDEMQNVGYTIKLITNKLAVIVTNDDFQFVNCLLKILKNYTVCGQYWTTFKDLLLSIKNLEPEIIEIILQECTITKLHIEDVNRNIMRNLCSQIYSQIDHKLLSSFKSLIEHKKTSLKTKESAVSEFNRVINSPDLCLAKDESDNEEDIIQKGNKTNNSNDMQNENFSFPLHRIDNVPKPHSAYGREKFWKFYVYVNSLQEGLKHNDYDYVMNILNSVKKHQQSFFTRACYRILCNEIKYSQYHLSKLISHSVQIGATAISYQVLLNVSKCILARLAEKNLWVFAYILLKDIYIMLQPQIHLHQFDAATVMLFVEIYLANQQAVKAYTLLKQTNIIYTDHHKWNVHCTVKDSSTRAQIITILLNALCEIFPEYALFLFEFLIADQYSNFYPIDLTNFANKIIPVLLLKEDHNLILNIAKLIVQYNFVLKIVTCRALIAKLVHIDMTLAKHLYQTAINLGIYSRVQFHPTMYLIINCDWTKEEMYLAILDLMEQLSSNIGHALDHINPRGFSIYLIFENILPNEKSICNREMNYRCDIRIEESKVLMKTVLQKQFNPRILIINNKTDRICKLSSVSILQYLKCKHCI